MDSKMDLMRAESGKLKGNAKSRKTFYAFQFILKYKTGQSFFSSGKISSKAAAKFDIEEHFNGQKREKTEARLTKVLPFRIF